MNHSIPYLSLPEAMEKFLLPRTQNLVVAGTHGKTTTSSLLSFVLKECGQDPSYFIGGVSLDLPESFVVHDTSKYFVLEGDEYDTAFWDKVPKFNHYLPTHTILTSVEYDHADIYPDLAAVMKAFDGLLMRTQPQGWLIANTDQIHVRELLERSVYTKNLNVISYGVDEQKAQLVVKNITTDSEGVMHFSITPSSLLPLHQSSPLSETVTLKLNLPGQHNALNATAIVGSPASIAA
jgi:UDP-N-acetylmuramate: L-alanyl-gamma-D-glutamyl-meso-diaminopimelate ligase